MYSRLNTILLLLFAFVLAASAQQCWPRNTQHPPGYNQTLIGCILFKNEARYLKEWLVYHQLAGFDHMYMYNHQSTDESVSVLKPFIDMGFVTVFDWDDKPGLVQTNQIHHCHTNFGYQAYWTALFDIDEFFVSMFDHPADDPSGFLVRPLMKWFKNSAGVELFRANFDSNGHNTPPSGLVMDQYTSRWTDENLAGKVITQYKHIESLAGHTAKPKAGHKVVDTLHWDVWGDHGRHYANGPLRINHYITRSYSECQAKINQTAFPGSWRSTANPKYCDHAMLGTEHYYPWQHYRDDWLSYKWGKTVQACMEKIK